MAQDPFPASGQDVGEPEGSAEWPGDDEEGAAQGLFVCLPPEHLTLAGFAQDGTADTMMPGPLLATLVHAITGEDGKGLAALSDDQLVGVLSAARRLESRAAWTQLAAIGQFAARRAVGGRGNAEFAADEIADELHTTWQSAADQMAYAATVAERLPRTFAALAAGRLHPVHVRIIEDVTSVLSADDAARADEVLSEEAGSKTFSQLRYAAHRLVLKLDPDAARRRKEAAKRDAHVRRFREDSGNAGMVARELPPDEVLASWQHVEQRALDLRAAGMDGTLQELRVRAYLDLLQERDSRDSQGNPGMNRPGDGDGDGDGGQDNHGPSVAALVNITVPLSTVLGQPGAPGEAGGFGLLDAETARDLVTAAARHPQTRWCVTALRPDGTAAAHGCAVGRHPIFPSTVNPTFSSTVDRANTCNKRAGPGPPASGPQAGDFLRNLRIRLASIACHHCDHGHVEAGYQPSRRLAHLIRARNARCTAPGCSRPAARCDLDHTTAWDQGGATCECNIAPLCRHHHRCKQAEGWLLEQPEPGVLRWRTPAGRFYTTTPTVYPA